MIRTYSELIMLPTFEERYEYLKLEGVVLMNFKAHNHISREKSPPALWQKFNSFEKQRKGGKIYEA